MRSKWQNLKKKPPALINKQCVVYEYKCDLCDAGYVGYTCQHLFQRINKHKHSVIGKHLQDVHNLRNKDLRDQFTILKKCCQTLDCLIYEMLFIKIKKTTLNTQSDCTKAKLIIWQFQRTTLGILFYFLFLIIYTETFTHTFHCIMNSSKVFYVNLRMVACRRQKFILLYGCSLFLNAYQKP